MIRKCWERIMFKWRLREMDRWWYDSGGCCFGIIPPSVYYTHTEEEVRQIKAEKIKELRDIIEEFELRYKGEDSAERR